MARNKSSTITERARIATKQKLLKKTMSIIVAALMVLILMVYLTSMMYTKFGSFTVQVNKYDQLNYGLSLSETRDFGRATSNLNCRASETITNIDGSILNEQELGKNDGLDSGENYLCYTFYCKNTGEVAVNYRASIVSASMTMGIEEAVRIRVITSREGQESEKKDYALPKGVDAYGYSVPEDGTIPFITKNTIMSEKMDNFMPGEVTKYTIVIWLEGNDEQCIDDIIGGTYKIDMKFEIIGKSEIETNAQQ